MRVEGNSGQLHSRSSCSSSSKLACDSIAPASRRTRSRSKRPRLLSSGWIDRRSRASIHEASTVHRIDECRDPAVGHEHENVHILRQARRSVVVVGDGPAVGPRKLEAIEDALEHVDDLHQ